MEILFLILFFSMVGLGVFSIWLNLTVFFPKERIQFKKGSNEYWGENYQNKKPLRINKTLYSELYYKYVTRGRK